MLEQVNGIPYLLRILKITLLYQNYLDIQLSTSP